MGIGEALAKQFAKPGHVLILVARSEDKLKQLCATLAPQCAETHYYTCDLLEPQQREALLQWYQSRFPHLNVLINNAGWGIYGPILNYDLEPTRKLFELNFFAPLDLIQKFAPLLKGQDKATIINISSIAGHRGVPLMSSYCASKFALNGLTEAIRIELKEQGIHCVNIYPGATETPFSDNAQNSGWQPNQRHKKFADSAQKVALKTYRAYLKKKREDYINWTNPFIKLANNLLPKLVDWGLGRFYRKNRSLKENS